MTTKTIILDITEKRLPPLVTVKQGDSGRTLEAVIQDGGKDFVAPLGTTATLRIMGTQGRSASVLGTVVAFGGKTTVTVGLTSDALAYAGKYAADIKLSSPDGSESTLNFWLEVQIAPASDTPIPTPGGGITQEELDRALRQNSAVDQKFASEAVGDLAEKTGVKIRPRVCFVDDDGGSPVPTVLYPWMVEHDVPYNFAIATGDIETGGDSFASWADLRAMQADSRVSWSCHAINDDVMSDYTPEQMEAKYKRWRRDMTAHGLRSDAITVMYNHGSSVQETIDKVVSKYFRFGFSTTKGINTAPFDNYHMLRVGLFPRDGSYTLAQAKSLVDQLVAAGTGVVVFFTHCYFESFDLGGLTELVEYIRAKGVEIAALEDALRLYDPKIACDCGDWMEASGEPEYRKSIAQATSATAGQKVANSSDQNCVLTVQVSGKRVRAAGTAYSNNGMISWLDSEGNVIGCVWQGANSSGDNARFSLELPVPHGATAIMVSGNSGRQLPRVEVLSTGSGGGITAEEAGRIAENKVKDIVPSWARAESKPTYSADDVGAIPATDYAVYADTKAGTAKKALPVSLQHAAVLFGLSKAAGVDLAGRTDVGIGNYPSDAKDAIAQMLGVPTESQFSESILEIREMLPTAGGGVSKAAAEALWAILQKTAYVAPLTDAEKAAFKAAWGIEDTPSTPDEPEPDEPDDPPVEPEPEYATIGTFTASNYINGATGDIPDEPSIVNRKYIVSEEIENPVEIIANTSLEEVFGNKIQFALYLWQDGVYKGYTGGKGSFDGEYLTVTPGDFATTNTSFYTFTGKTARFRLSGVTGKVRISGRVSGGNTAITPADWEVQAK